MKKILSVLTMFVILGSSVPAFAHGFDNGHKDKIMPVQERVQPKLEHNPYEIQKPPYHNDKQVSKVLKGAAVGAIIASLLN